MKSDETTISRDQNMPYNYFTEKLLGLQDLIITNIKEVDKSLKIFAKLEVKEQHCPCCGTTTRTIHDYRKQIIKDIPIRRKNVEIYFKKEDIDVHIMAKDLQRKTLFYLVIIE